jgi:hypothetical protein
MMPHYLPNRAGALIHSASSFLPIQYCAAANLEIYGTNPEDYLPVLHGCLHFPQDTVGFCPTGHLLIRDLFYQALLHSLFCDSFLACLLRLAFLLQQDSLPELHFLHFCLFLQLSGPLSVTGSSEVISASYCFNIPSLFNFLLFHHTNRKYSSYLFLEQLRAVQSLSKNLYTSEL